MLPDDGVPLDDFALALACGLKGGSSCVLFKQPEEDQTTLVLDFNSRLQKRVEEIVKTNTLYEGILLLQLPNVPGQPWKQRKLRLERKNEKSKAWKIHTSKMHAGKWIKSVHIPAAEMKLEVTADPARSNCTDGPLA